ncbi:MAG: hypothetical protein IPO69_21300 [Saprospiraceae bacterium]|nr:hypothetical protein [Saprospiraceae bacterium]
MGDFVWYDQNNIGIQDGGEPGLGSVTVRLYDDQTIITFLMDWPYKLPLPVLLGLFLHRYLPGRYIVSIVIPSSIHPIHYYRYEC